MKIRKSRRSVGNKGGIPFEHGLIRWVSLLTVAAFFTVLLVYYATLKNIFLEQLVRTNTQLNAQVVNAYEFAMKQITGNIFKIPLYDQELNDMTGHADKDELFTSNILKKLDRVAMSNPYISSVYFYQRKSRMVYVSETGSKVRLEDFSDKEAVTAATDGRITILDPRRVRIQLGERMLISVVCPLPLYSGADVDLLVINVDAGQLFYDIQKRNLDDTTTRFFVTTQDGTIIIHKDPALMFTKTTPEMLPAGGRDSWLHKLVAPQKQLTSVIDSDTLHWRFVLRTTVQPDTGFTQRMLPLSLLLLALLLVLLVGMIRMIRVAVRPVRRVFSEYHDKLFAEYLTDTVVDPVQAASEMIQVLPAFASQNCAVLLAQLPDVQEREMVMELTRMMKPVDTKWQLHGVQVSRRLVALAVAMPGDDDSHQQKLRQTAVLLKDCLSVLCSGAVPVGISAVHAGFQELPAAYREASTALDFRLRRGEDVIWYTDFQNYSQRAAFDYPYAIEKQLVNNLMVGNPEGCRLFLEKFFAALDDADVMLTDQEIRTYIYQLQTTLLKTVSNMPVQIRIDSATDILGMHDFGEITRSVEAFVLRAADEISRAGEDEASVMIQNILDYIDRKFTQDDFNLNAVSDALGLNRNYLARVIREVSGETFNDYVNHKRISLAKTLLRDTTLSVEQIARQTGFSYANYFIRVFKGSEGVTPGQFRSALRGEASV